MLQYTLFICVGITKPMDKCHYGLSLLESCFFEALETKKKQEMIYKWTN